jgi:hypothetical protein
MANLEYALAQERAAIIEDFAERAIDRDRNYRERVLKVIEDTSTLQGALAEAERRFARERVEESEAGNEAVAALQVAHNAERLQIERDFFNAATDRMRDFADRTFAAINDASTLSGQLAAFDREAQRQRLAEIKAGGEAINELETALAAERFSIIKRASDEFSAFINNLTRDLRSFMDELKSGGESPLAPSGRLAVARAAYQAQLGLAQGGDTAAASGITQYASGLLDAARAFHGSSPAFQAIFNQIESDLDALPDVLTGNAAIVAELRAANSNLGESISIQDQMKFFVDKLGEQDRALQMRTDADFHAPALSLLKGQLDQLTVLAKKPPVIIVPPPPPEEDHEWYEFDRMGGVVGRYAAGGMVGNGVWDRDSVVARYATGGGIMLAGGEFVTRAPSVNAQTLPILEAINGGRFPMAAARIAAAANDNAGVFAALLEENRAMRRDINVALARLAQIGVDGSDRVVGAIGDSTRSAQRTARELQREREIRKGRSAA